MPVMILVLGSVIALAVQLAAASVAHGTVHTAAPEARNGRIAYVLGSRTGSTDVASIRPSGTGSLNLTASEANELYVDVSPDGTSIAFTRFRRGGEIFTVPVTGGEARRLTRDRVHDELPIWSPDSSRIAFVRYAGTADAEIFVMDADGSNMVRITDNEADDADPRWSPDGTQLIYNSGSIDLNEQDVYLVTLADLGTRNLTSDGVNDSFAEWAPDGTRVAYASYRNDQWDVYVVTANGTATTQLTDDPPDEFGPRWSPDGIQILYVNGRLEGELPPDQVYVMNPDGSDKRSVSPPRLQVFSPVWAPNGRKIAFIGRAGTASNWEIFTVRSGGTDLVRLTRSKAMEFDPSWAPADLT